MPMIQINLLSGYSAGLKERLTRTLTAVVGNITQAHAEAITVWIHEVEPEDYSRGGTRRRPGPGAADPVTQVSGYLDAMQRRDLNAAQDYLADGFVMTFPGSRELTTLSALVNWSKDHYRHIEKTVTSMNVAYELDHAIVIVNGTLAGEWPDGSTFDGVRFIDRFEIRDNRLLRQDVWNDLANTRP